MTIHEIPCRPPDKRRDGARLKTAGSRREIDEALKAYHAALLALPIPARLRAAAIRVERARLTMEDR